MSDRKGQTVGQGDPRVRPPDRDTQIEWSVRPDGGRWLWNIRIVRDGWLSIDGRDTWHGSARSRARAERQMWAAIEKAYDRIEAERSSRERSNSGSLPVDEVRRRLVRDGSGGPIRG